MASAMPLNVFTMSFRIALAMRNLLLLTLLSGLGFTRAAEYFYDVIPNRFSDEESAVVKRFIRAWFSRAAEYFYDVIPNRFSDEESAVAKRCIGAWFSHAEQNGKGTSLLVPTSFLLNDAPNRFSDEESAERAKCDPYLKKKLRSSFNT